MTGIQIFLVIVGVVTVAGSFIFSDLFDKSDSAKNALSGLDEEAVKKKIDEVVDMKVEEAVSEAIEERMESTEIQLERISNEKIMAVNDYSETVLDQISHNHEEVMFLYGMLSDKENDIKNTVQDVESVKRSVRELEKEQQKDDNEDEKALRSLLAGEVALALDEMAQDETAQDETASENHPGGQKDETLKRQKRGSQSKNNNQKILELYEQGVENIDIAKKLGLGIGEVRLVIDLYKNRQDTR